MIQDELTRLEEIAKNSMYSAGVNEDSIKYCFLIFKRWLTGKSILELGPAEGVMTELLVQTGKKLTVVEGSELFCNNLRRRFPEITVIHSLFENFETEESFDNIVMSHVLEHVIDPVDILKKAKGWLNPGGRILASVPNARSLHRQAGVLMGLLPVEDALNEMDIHHGHRRVFTPETFRAIFLQAGLKIEFFGGYWLKPLPNALLESWPKDMLYAYMQLGERYPDIAAEIYVIATQP